MASEFVPPLGFKAAGTHCGIKRAKKDLSLIVSDVPASAAGVFTTNRVIAAPVVLSRTNVAKRSGIRAIITNSGNANACTGELGDIAACTMSRETAAALGCRPDEVLVSSTGVIGQPLPVEKIVDGLGAIVAELSADGFPSATEGIMTTDTFPKYFSEQFPLGGKTITISGIAKGSGMIAPNMATMLGYVCTDANINNDTLQAMLSGATKQTFNRITVDGDTSTNDMVLLLANGAANGSEIFAGSSDAQTFTTHLESVCRSLAQSIVRDGEGANKFVAITVRGAVTEKDAETAARSIAGSSLVKTAIHGEDANWGRIAAAVGYSGIDFAPEKMEILLGDVVMLAPPYRIDFSEAAAKEVLSKKDIDIIVDLHAGDAEATCWTCDLSKDYVHINASYRS